MDVDSQSVTEMSANVTMATVSNVTTKAPLPDLNEMNRFSPSLMTLTAVLIATFMVVGLFGNAITIVALLRCPRVRNVTAAFICSLCVADFSFCLLVLPFEVSRFANGQWLFGDGFICVLFPLLRYWNVGCSLLSIAMITINRFVMIAFNNVYNKIYERRWVVVQILFIWGYSFGMLVPTLAGQWGRFGYHPLLMTCTVVRDANGNSAKKALFLIGFLIPCIAIVICYVGIFLVIVLSDRRMRRHSVKAGVKETTQQKKSREERRRKNEMRITRMSLVIFLTFLLCYLPVTVSKIKDPFVKYPGLHILGYILCYFSACVNPIIYVIMSKQYRQAYKTVLFCRRPRLFSDSSMQSKESKSRDGVMGSRTYMSQVSNDSVSGGTAMEELPDVFPDPKDNRK
ncbi:G-protein coupled receptor moody-like [Amphibalanus amphitrite]|uniref:G-protein coupled receptor moody-like n=1 Tax=Amphibalanus amphitrite TaxID=1232801 RepID=UPI001C91286F|nr:G-protein coupled receptor moody-like [Amphibalanus amphitrite]XP_043212107.1 G-protein coupled receptor moody-like [Amphibalanus amphitrite]XP_043226437.1 G-protein coupled receptor moody-like [Amphibalanus amphitrite]XP_043226438.1 G-protein coupled receptor moody-like [Amphibalanus amphitrite]